MSASKKVFLVICLCFSTSGCFLPISAGLALKPIGYFARSHITEDKVATNGPISVSEMLDRIWGEGPSLPTNEDIHKVDPPKTTITEMLKKVRQQSPENIRPRLSLSAPKMPVALSGKKG